jgi:diadenosine tetraphosphatase ApaH/serine/threonine PP2A family protein phosphatase
VPGAVAVSSRGRRGGHVAIVSRIIGGQIYVWNPSPRGQGWQEIAYRHRAISFRVPG